MGWVLGGVGGWWAVIIVSALLLLFLNRDRDFESGILRFEQRWAGAELDNKVDKALSLTLIINFVKLHVQSHQGNLRQELNYQWKGSQIHANLFYISEPNSFRRFLVNQFLLSYLVWSSIEISQDKWNCSPYFLCGNTLCLEFFISDRQING